MSSTSSSSTSLSTAKQLLRKKMRRTLKEMTPEDKKEQSRQITEKVLKNERTLASSRVSIYLNTQNEVSTRDLLRHLMTQGKEIFIPKYDPNSHDMKMVSLKSMEEYESLPMTSWNIKQHPLDLDQDDALDTGGLDLIITPGLAFTKSGQRMGSGRGYYDRYFEKIRQLHHQKEWMKHQEQWHHQHPSREPDQLQYLDQKDLKQEMEAKGSLIQQKSGCTHLMGLSFKQQLLAFIPTNHQDMTMDQVIYAGHDDDD